MSILLMNYDDLQSPIEPPEKYETYIFKNFTSSFLVPQFFLFDKEFNYNVNATLWGAFGINDESYEYYTEYDNKLFMLTHPLSSNLQYWMDNFEHYIYDDGLANKLMVILDLPIDNRNAFLEGRYTDLYDKETIDKIIPQQVVVNEVTYKTEAWEILNKTEERREKFENKVNKDFALNPKIKIETSAEYEYPPNMIREVFNYGKSKTVAHGDVALHNPI